MSDALSLLRASVKAKRDFHEDDDKIIFGDLYYPKSVKTTYLIYGYGYFPTFALQDCTILICCCCCCCCCCCLL